MKLIDRYEFTNGKSIETWYLESTDIRERDVPECDVIGLRYVYEDGRMRMTVMRPDEALIQAQLLIQAVLKSTSGYEIELKQEVAHAAVEEG